MYYINKIKEAKKCQELKDPKKVNEPREMKKVPENKEFGIPKLSLNGASEFDIKAFKKTELDYRFKFSKLFEIAPKNL